MYAILAIEDIIHLAVDGIHDLVACCMHFLQCCIAYLTCCCCCSKYGCKKYLYPVLSYTCGICFLMTITILVLFLIYTYTDWIEQLLANADIKLSGILFNNDDALSNKMNTLIRKFSKRGPATVDNTIPKINYSNDNVDLIISPNLPTNDMVEDRNLRNTLFYEFISNPNKSLSPMPYFLPCFNETTAIATRIHRDNIVVNSDSDSNLFKFNSYLNSYNTGELSTPNSKHNMKRYNEENVTEKVLLTQIPYFTNKKVKLIYTEWAKNFKRDNKREDELFKCDLYKNNYTQGFTVMNFFKTVSLVPENITGKRLLTVICNFTRAEDNARLETKTENKDHNTTKNINIDTELLFDDLQKYRSSKFINNKSQYENQFYYNRSI